MKSSCVRPRRVPVASMLICRPTILVLQARMNGLTWRSIPRGEAGPDLVLSQFGHRDESGWSTERGRGGPPFILLRRFSRKGFCRAQSPGGLLSRPRTVGRRDEELESRPGRADRIRFLAEGGPSGAGLDNVLGGGRGIAVAHLINITQTGDVAR